MTSPSLARFQHEIGVRMGRGDLLGAARMAARCRAAWPADRAGWLLGSIAALLEDQKDAALALVEARLRAHPEDVQCLIQKAECLFALGRRTAALEAAEAAAQCSDETVALDSVGEFFAHTGEYARALKVYDRAVAAAPTDPTLLAKRAVVQRFLGNFDRAESDYEAVLVMLPRCAKVLKGLVELRRETSERNCAATMEEALAATPGDSQDAAILHFGLAKSYEDLGRYQASWRHLTAGNRLERSRIQYDPATDRALMERLIGGFPDIETPAGDSTGERPIFIVGIPRTGTTLVDRIIGGHSQVHSAGELSVLSEAIAAAMAHDSVSRPLGWHPFVESLGRLDPRVVANEYLTRARPWRGNRPRFSDKQLTNFFYCALILRAFPNARIVHLTRHPLAACYAIYRTRFDGTYPFSYALDEIAEFYVGYRRVMAHWHRVLPNRILDLAYEDVVTSLEPTARRLFNYLELPFEPACLDFHLNPAPVQTASSVQVRQPLYGHALHLWENYRTELAPVRARLEAAGIPID